MRKEEIASWDGGKSTWGGRVRVFGTIPVIKDDGWFGVHEDGLAWFKFELNLNLKVHEMIIKKDSNIVKEKVERKSLALKAKKESSNEECLTSKSEDEKYAMAVKDFKKLLREEIDLCGDPDHLIRECSKPPKYKNHRAFFGGSWSDGDEEDDEKVKNKTFFVAQASSETSSLVDDDLDEEEAIRETKKKYLENVVEDETSEFDEIVNIKESNNHPLENFIGNLNQRTLTSEAQNQSNFFCFISTIEPKNINEALGDES
uniref:Gag-Pol polyprotein n=1 Tax=Tanacetum cinerariifolium TaxID=118510 RepID=A0A6L2KWW0_TANCI|nr:Gag-Pol polyprotein [Tanacetum cinerariifolium]